MTVAIASFFHEPTSTWTHVASDPATGEAAIVDSVLDFEPAGGVLATHAAREVLAHLHAHQLRVRWILESHAHADHLSAADWLRTQTGANVVAGAGIVDVQSRFREKLALDPPPAHQPPAFDRLVADGDTLPLGKLQIEVWATPGHTADSVSYRIGDVVFIGDTLFSPASGSARCDFPGGNASELYASVQRLYALPDDTCLYLCHDYPPEGIAPRNMVSVREQRQANVHLAAGTRADEFVAMRRQRDATLPPPRLFWPALQVNIEAGAIPQADAHGRRFLKIPLDTTALEETP